VRDTSNKNLILNTAIGILGSILFCGALTYICFLFLNPQDVKRNGLITENNVNYTPTENFHAGGLETDEEELFWQAYTYNRQANYIESDKKVKLINTRTYSVDFLRCSNLASLELVDEGLQECESFFQKYPNDFLAASALISIYSMRKDCRNVLNLANRISEIPDENNSPYVIGDAYADTAFYILLCEGDRDLASTLLLKASQNTPPHDPRNNFIQNSISIIDSNKEYNYLIFQQEITKNTTFR
jgi:hypothetical protein